MYREINFLHFKVPCFYAKFCLNCILNFDYFSCQFNVVWVLSLIFCDLLALFVALFSNNQFISANYFRREIEVNRPNFTAHILRMPYWIKPHSCLIIHQANVCGSFHTVSRHLIANKCIAQRLFINLVEKYVTPRAKYMQEWCYFPAFFIA